MRPVAKESRREAAFPTEKMSCGGRGGGGLVGAHGLGPWTSSLSETRSNQLSYAPGFPYPYFLRLPGIREADSAMRCALPGPPKSLATFRGPAP